MSLCNQIHRQHNQSLCLIKYIDMGNIDHHRQSLCSIKIRRHMMHIPDLLKKESQTHDAHTRSLSKSQTLRRIHPKIQSSGLDRMQIAGNCLTQRDMVWIQHALIKKNVFNRIPLLQDQRSDIWENASQKSQPNAYNEFFM